MTGITFVSTVNPPDSYVRTEDPNLSAVPTVTTNNTPGLTSRFDIQYTESYDQEVNDVTLGGGFVVDPNNPTQTTRVFTRTLIHEEQRVDQQVNFSVAVPHGSDLAATVSELNRELGESYALKTNRFSITDQSGEHFDVNGNVETGTFTISGLTGQVATAEPIHGRIEFPVDVGSSGLAGSYLLIAPDGTFVANGLLEGGNGNPGSGFQTIEATFQHLTSASELNGEWEIRIFFEETSPFGGAFNRAFLELDVPFLAASAVGDQVQFNVINQPEFHEGFTVSISSEQVDESLLGGQIRPGVIPLGNLFDDSSTTSLRQAIISDSFDALADATDLGLSLIHI